MEHFYILEAYNRFQLHKNTLHLEDRDLYLVFFYELGGLSVNNGSSKFKLKGHYKVFRRAPIMYHLWLISYVKKITLYIKFLLVSYSHFLKISFNLAKCGLSYGFKHDLRPFSKFTQVWNILSLTASKMDFGGCQ